MATALLIVDVQRDFVPGGALAVPHGDEVIAPANELARSGAFDVVVATRDWHPPDHGSFAAGGGPWPPHCVAESAGAQLDPRLDADRIDAVVDKGRDAAAAGYSGFEATDLAQLLREEGVDTVTVVGLATEHCVRATALDALREGFRVVVDTAATRGISAAAADDALAELRHAGALVR